MYYIQLHTLVHTHMHTYNYIHALDEGQKGVCRVSRGCRSVLIPMPITVAYVQVMNSKRLSSRASHRIASHRIAQHRSAAQRNDIPTNTSNHHSFLATRFMRFNLSRRWSFFSFLFFFLFIPEDSKLHIATPSHTAQETPSNYLAK